MENTTKVITGMVRFCFARVFEPVANEEGGTPKYSVCLLIPKSDKATVSKVRKAMEAAKQAYKADLQDKKGNIPDDLNLALRDGDTERDSPEFEGHFFINATSKFKPGIVDKDLNPILSREEFYSGCFGRASINFYGYAKNGNKGIAASLNNLQKLRDGDPLSGGASAESDFGGENALGDDDIL